MQDHQRHLVRHDVVHISRDPGPFLSARLLDAGGPLPQALEDVTARTDPQADRQREPDEHSWERKGELNAKMPRP
ncbi:hypothetical protein, partial [Streptomyces rhizosphaericus]|uniref:hypothetical protein n=1 Tax=Streptomyces rhizosphaericus TaxID=114699 RepID=UPI001FC996D9